MQGLPAGEDTASIFRMLECILGPRSEAALLLILGGTQQDKLLVWILLLYVGWITFIS